MAIDTLPVRRNYVLPVLRSSWSALPVLLGVGVVSCLIAGLTAYAFPGTTPVGVLVLGIIIVPLLATLVQFMQDSIGQDAYGFTGYLRRFPAAALRSVAVSVVPSVIAAVALVALGAWNATGNPFWLIPLGVGGASTVLTALGMIIAIPVRLAAPEVTTRQLWSVSFAIVAHAPIPVVAVAAIGVLGIWACLTISAGLVLVVPPVLAIVWAAAALTSCEQAGFELLPEECD
jgi:hypothetical protein